MKKICIMFISLFFLVSHNTFAQNKKGSSQQKRAGSPIFREFSQAHDWVMRREGVFEMDMSFLGKGSTGKLETETAKIFLNHIAKVIYLIQKGKPTLLLNHEIGSWITDKEQAAPMKIAGSFVVYGLMNVDDVIGLDLRKTYKVEKDMGTAVLLKGRKKGTAYPYMLLKKIGKDKFEAEFKDHTRRSIKKGTFDLGPVDGIKVIKRAVYRDLVIDTKRSTSYETKKISKSKIPALALDPSKFKSIFGYIGKN